MTTEAIKSYYLGFIRDMTDKYVDSYSGKNETQFKVVKFSECILDYLIKHKNLSTLTEVEYGTFKKILKSDDDDNIQYTLYLLSLKPYDVLEWVHYIESEDFYEPERAYISENELANILMQSNFYNPLTGEEVSKKEFSEILNTVFSVTTTFKNKLHSTSELGL